MPGLSRTFTAYRMIAISLTTVTSLAVVVAAQQPRVVNGQLATQPAGSPFAQSFRALVGAQADVAWIGYTVPVVPTEGDMCCFSNNSVWVSGGIVMSDGSNCCAACRLEPAPSGTAAAPTAPPPQSVVKLEGSNRMLVLFRVTARQIDRIRVFSENCALDAGGRPVIWLEGVRPPDSVAMLESLAAPTDGRRDRVTDGAISAIALHNDASADASLDRLVATSQPAALRRKVTFWLGNSRGAHGFAVLTRILKDDPSADVQKSAVVGVAQSHEPGVVDTLANLARSHTSPGVRGDAIFWLGQKAQQRATAAITERIDQDPDTEVKKRAVFALSQFPKDEGVPLLIQVARTHANREVRKQAMFWLGQSKDPRAIDFFVEILK
jgi:HEAT repeats